MPEQVGRVLSGTELWLADGFGEETGWSTHAGHKRKSRTSRPPTRGFCSMPNCCVRLCGLAVLPPCPSPAWPRPSSGSSKASEVRGRRRPSQASTICGAAVVRVAGPPRPAGRARRALRSFWPQRLRYSGTPTPSQHRELSVSSSRTWSTYSRATLHK